MEVLNTVFNKSKAEEHTLNHSNSKILQVCLESVYPTVKLALELRAVQHNNSVFFSIQTWRTIALKRNEIRQAMRAEDERLIFVNDELKVFTECMHDHCAVCFLDIRGKRVNIMLETFSRMMQLGLEITKEYQKQIKTINETAKNLSTFMDFILSQCTGTRRCDNIKEHLEMLSNYTEHNIGNAVSNFSFAIDDNEYEKDYDESDGYDRCSYCSRRRHRY
ncbi:uncharacterized protein LOC103317895 isoform X1 [Nasonia vitripennis]|uniref:Uncharacterized protein n=1 Tax=Nasonia vitripennis TaxID=7425 RepID=A0A7M7HGG7_NASVI|nr:uncharacterized protein LOC103317895 isoform X1 [Nasonia vitripennis]